MDTEITPNHPPLEQDSDSCKAAIDGQVIQYPRVVRSGSDPPILNQLFGLVSFKIFNPPYMFRGKPIYGAMKMRGNYPDENTALNKAHELVRSVDSKFQIRISNVGEWVLITDNDSVIKDLYDLRENDEEKHIRDRIVHEREAEARKIAKELQENAEALKTGKDIYDCPESLNFYTMKRVTEMKLLEAVLIQERKLNETKNLLIKTHMILRLLEKDNPQYASEWIDNYNNERRKTSLPDFVASTKQFDRYDSTSLEKLQEEYPEIFRSVLSEMELYGDKSEK